MTNEYAHGYYAALWGCPSWWNPWNVYLVTQRRDWAEGHRAARLDLRPVPLKKPRPKLELVR